MSNKGTDTANHYDDFFGPFYFEPYALEVAKRIVPEKVSVALEIAAGTGRMTRHIRKRIAPTARLVASDISDSMLAVAKNKLNDLNIEWQNINAEQIPFDDNSIDLVVCCFGYMFVPDKTKAFVEVHRVLKPGGQFLFTTWDKLENNAASYIARSIAETYLDQPINPSYNLATSMSDASIIDQLLQDANFSGIEIETVKLLSSSPTAMEATEGFINGGGIYDDIKKLNPAWLDEIKIKVEKTFAEKFGAAPMITPISALICQGWK